MLLLWPRHCWDGRPLVIGDATLVEGASAAHDGERRDLAKPGGGTSPANSTAFVVLATREFCFGTEGVLEELADSRPRSRPNATTKAEVPRAIRARSVASRPSRCPSAGSRSCHTGRQRRSLRNDRSRTPPPHGRLARARATAERGAGLGRDGRRGRGHRRADRAVPFVSRDRPSGAAARPRTSVVLDSQVRPPQVS
jgi:hypothetical protein